MKNSIAILFATAALAFAAGQTFTGVITDDMCKDANHKKMKMASDAKCVAECIKGMHGNYVLYDGKASYKLSDQKAPAKFAAKKVTVTGTLDEKTQTITVASMAAAK